MTDWMGDDGDGIPTRKKRSSSFHQQLESIYGPGQVESLEVGRPELLIDVRYIGATRIFPTTKQLVVDRFREHGIHAQWLDYPQRYNRRVLAETYGRSVEDMLLRSGSVYSNEIEEFLKNTALQLFVVPGTSVDPDQRKRVYSRWLDRLGVGIDGYVNGFSAGNRAVVANRHDRFEEARLVLHELTHLVLPHDTDPENTGVMGTGDELDLLDAEWERLRANLANVRDTTGYDFALRPCLVREYLLRSLE
ncbi:hypothetical protein [Natronolimnobius sp. AArcel1]|uniref:hypothetical protein n=1 Tax=Natronolimnobius sp. AArcel1 TaxID=1679093 RepID=UPI0031B6C62E